MAEESIYNIIPKEYQPTPRGRLYKSKYPPDIPPTGSTFCHNTTSKPGISNLSGEFAVGLQAHTEYGNKSTLGHLKYDRKPSPEHFRKKNSGTMGNSTLPPVRNFSYDCTHKKVSVPKLHQKPILGLKSGKNFIVSNAIENILSSARKIKEEENWINKKQYGRIPEYLTKIKDSIDGQYKMIQNLHSQNQQKKQEFLNERHVLSEEEVRELREGLKRKWDEINREYQANTHTKLVDTVGLKRRKEGFQAQLSQIQQDIKKLNKLYIFVE